MTSSDMQYSVFIGEEKEGETRIMRHIDIEDQPLKTENEFGTKTIWEALIYTIEKKKLGDKKFIGTRKTGADNKLAKNYEWKTFNQIKELSENFAKGAEELNLCPETNIETEGKFRFMGIYSKNREEWMIADLGSHCNSVTVVPIYDTLGEESMQYIFKLTQLTTIVVEAKNLNKILNIVNKKQHSNISNLIVLDSTQCTDIQNKLFEAGIQIHTLESIIEKGQKSEVKLKPSTPDSIATICFTSGTTGVPKGVMITHKSLLCEISIITSKRFIFSSNDIYLSFLPLAHMMERLIITVCISFGIGVGFFSGNPRNVIDDAKTLKPTCICAVPRIFQRISEAIHDEIKKLSYLKKKIIDKAIESKLNALHNHNIVTHFFWDKVVFGNMRNILGGRIRFMLTGSAPVEKSLLDFLRICFSAVIFEGYGQTETNAGMILTDCFDTVPGHVGGPGWSNELKLIDHPELGYTSKDINEETGEVEPRGEILIRGPVIFKKYFCNPKATEEALDKDGWFHTGDVAKILTRHGNAIKIIDRVKNMFKLSQGEYVAPEKLENFLTASRYVAQLCVVGNPLESYLVAILVPRDDTVINYFKEKGKEVTKDNVKDYYNDNDLKCAILKDLETIGKNHDFKGFEIIKKLYMCKEPFSVDNDLLAPTLKNKRHNIQKKYKHEIDALYGR